MTEERGSTFADILRKIGKQFKFAAALTVLLTALLTLAIVFWYDPLVTEYSRSFFISFPGSESQKYPDGTAFYYHDLISEESLMRLKNGGDARFSSIDVGKIISEDAISIETDETMTDHFTVKVKGSFFQNADSVNAFLFAVANLAKQYAVEKAASVDFSLDEDIFESADYANRIELLALQRDSIVAQYDEWIAFYKESFPILGKTLANHRAEAVITFSEGLQSSLSEELTKNGYVPLDRLEERKASLQAEYDGNMRKIEELKKALPVAGAFVPALLAESSVTANTLDLSEMLASLIARNVEIESQISELTTEKVQAFEEKLSAAFQAQQKVSVSANRVSKALYENARVDPITAQAKREGGLGLAPALVCAFAVSAVLSCICAYLLALRAERRSPEPPEERADAAEKTD